VIVVAVTDVLTAVVVSKASEPLGEGELVIVVVEYMLLTSTTAEIIDGGGSE